MYLCKNYKLLVLGKFDKYKVDLKAMQADSCLFEFMLDNVFFANIDGPEVQKGKVNVTLTVKRSVGTFELAFQTEGIVLVPCDRCLDEMEVPVTSTDKLFVKFGSDYAEENNNVVIIPEDEGYINIAWFIYEFIALAIPMKHVHVPGKCNKGMVSKLNKHLRTTSDDEGVDEIDSSVAEEIEDVEEDSIDPRWNELKKILDNN